MGKWGGAAGQGVIRPPVKGGKPQSKVKAKIYIKCKRGVELGQQGSRPGASHL